MFQKVNDGVHISQIIARNGCSRHDAPSGLPCWDVYTETQDQAPTRAVCGSRIRAAGYVGVVTPALGQTLTKNKPTKKEVRV